MTTQMASKRVKQKADNAWREALRTVELELLSLMSAPQQIDSFT